eukprot:366351-Chlamydomonas_euryale.AAC.2
MRQEAAAGYKEASAAARCREALAAVRPRRCGDVCLRGARLKGLVAGHIWNGGLLHVVVC